MSDSARTFWLAFVISALGTFTMLTVVQLVRGQLHYRGLEDA